MQVAIVKYNAGTVYSVVNALRRLGVEPLLTDDPQQLQQADRVTETMTVLFEKLIQEV